MNMEKDDEAAAAVAVAPRVSLADIEASISSECSFTVGNAAAALQIAIGKSAHLMTVCILVLKNGYTIVGTSACASPLNFNDELGRKFAREDAIRQVWPLAGFELRTLLYRMG